MSCEGSSDLLVVGGGPAGLAVAIQGRLAGLRVRLIERRRPAIDKACGEGLLPDGVARLEALGVQIPREQRMVLRGIRYIDGPIRAEGRFGGGGGAGIRRTALHDAMRRRAEALGVDLRWGVAARGLERDAVRTDLGRFGARWIVAADGLRSRLRDWAGIPSHGAAQRRFGVRRHYAIAPWTDLVEVYWGAGAEAYVTPISRHEIGVALLWGGKQSSFDRLLSQFPQLLRRVEHASSTSTDRGAGPLRLVVARVTQGNLALVGDASGYVDAISGEGLSLALQQAQALIRSIERDDLALYARAHRRLGRFPDRLTRLLLFLERRPRLRRRVIRALAANPETFSGLLSIHARTLRLRQFDLAGALRFARAFVAS